MSREIKFRAWDYVLKEMSVPFYPYYAREFMPPPLLEYCGQDIELLEFTGLQDKKGKDIYEGDILKFDADEWGDESGVFPVEWDGKMASWIGFGLASEWPIFCEVIGNTYENPELLEDKP